MLLGVEQPCSIELRDRRAYAPDGRSVSMEDIALDSLHTQEQEQIMGTASYVSPECPPPFAAQVIEVEVDIDTGQVTEEDGDGRRLWRRHQPGDGIWSG